MPEDAPARAKAALRDRFRAYRHSLSATAYATQSTAIIERVRALPVLRTAQAIHLYWPMVEAREIDTRPLIRWLRDQDKIVVLPRVITFARDVPPHMEHLRFSGTEDLRRNEWGLYEPTGKSTVPPDALEAIVVPALGAGRNGHRIGYGRGFYDVFLRPLDVPTVCLVYDACFVDHVPVAPHDVPVGCIVTEREVFKATDTA